MAKENQKKFKCDQCPKEYTDKSNLKNHKEVHHDPNCSIAKNHPCSLCHLKFTTKSSRDMHYKNIHSRLKSTCEICNKEVLHLQLHKLIHVELREKFKCEICSKEYLGKSELTRHKLTHSNRQKQKCDICEEEVFHLRVHKLTHITALLNPLFNATRKSSVWRASAKMRRLMTLLYAF